MDLPSVTSLITGGSGAAGGIVAGIILAKKFLNGHVIPACPGADAFAEIKTGCRLMKEAVDRNTKVSEEATAALLTVVKALVAMEEGNKR
jgi:hypothetical protein